MALTALATVHTKITGTKLEWREERQASDDAEVTHEPLETLWCGVTQYLEMSEVPEIPEIPEEFESEAEIKQYIEQLQRRIDFLEKEQSDFEKEKQELEAELKKIEDYLSASNQELESSHTDLEAVIQRIESIELHGKPSDVGLQENLRNPNFGGN